MYTLEQLVEKLDESTGKYIDMRNAEAEAEVALFEAKRAVIDLQHRYWASLTGKTDKAKNAELMDKNLEYADALSDEQDAELELIQCHASTSVAREVMFHYRTLAGLLKGELK